MVIKPKNKRCLPRDIRVERGLEATSSHDHPWKYMVTVKSGTSRSQETLILAHNYTDMVGQLIGKFAKRGENLYVDNVSRSNRYKSIFKD